MNIGIVRNGNFVRYFFFIQLHTIHLVMLQEELNVLDIHLGHDLPGTTMPCDIPFGMIRKRISIQFDNHNGQLPSVKIP